MTWPRRHAGCFITFLITFAVWLPCVKNDFVDWDDLNMIVHNPRFNPPTWAGTAWYWTHPAWNLYQPMTTTLWALLAKIGWVDSPDQFGGHMNPAVFHITGVLLHAACATILFIILRRLFRSSTAAIVGTMVFAIHPIQTEAVVFAGVLNNPLAGFFSLLALWGYLSAVDPARTISPAQRRIRITASAVALLLALISKPSAVVVPAVAVILDLTFFRRGWKQILHSSAPLALVVLPCVVWTKMIQHGSAVPQPPMWFRPIIAMDAIRFYAEKIIWPFQLAIDYGRTPVFVFSHWSGVLIRIVPIGLATSTALVFAGRTRGIALAAIAVFVACLLPNAGLLPFDYQLFSTVADRYAYFAMIGPAVLAGALTARWSKLTGPAIVVLCFWIVRTQIQITTWQNGQSLFRHALDVNPDSWMSDLNLAVILAERAPDQAINLCNRAIRLRPERADAWNTLGTIRMAQHDRTAAIAAFGMAKKLAPNNPVFQQNLDRAIR